MRSKSFLFLSLIITFVTLVNIQRSAAACLPVASLDSHQNEIIEYRSSKYSDVAVLILPPTGGVNQADRHIADQLCKRNLTAVILNYSQPPVAPGDVTLHDYFSKQTLRTIDDFLAGRSEAKWAIVGSSLGSLYASMAFGISHGAWSPEVFPHLMKLQAAVLTASGGPLAEILASSQFTPVINQRAAEETVLRSESIAAYQRRMTTEIQYDPIALSISGEHSHVLMFSSTTDKIIPSKTQDELWQAWGCPQRMVFATNHFDTIVHVYFFYGAQIAAFITSALEL